MKRHAITVLGVAVVYWLLDRFNAAVVAPTSWAHFSQGVDWVYLPSGVRLVAVLAFGVWGCVGITCATFILTFITQPNEAWTMGAVTAVISGFSPLMAAKLGQWWWDISQDLNGLTSRQLIALAGLFAVISGGLHQVWYRWSGISATSWDSAIAMIVGDFLGSLVLLFLMSWGLRSLNRLH